MSKAAYIAGFGILSALGVGYWFYHYTYAATSLALVPDPDASGSGADDSIGTAEAEVTAAIVGWKSVGSASDWLPTLAQAEQNYALPVDLLARIAYQESHFREEIIRGTKVSPAGALGIMQLEPAYFPSVRAMVPFTDDDIAAQIQAAGQEVERLYGVFSDWSLAIAAYNAGQGNVRKYAGIPPFPETEKYVSDIVADVPGLA